MAEFDFFTDQLLDEAKVFLEKAKHAESAQAQNAFLHASLLLSISALEAYVNAIAAELLVNPYAQDYNVYEQALLLEKDIKFDSGEFKLSNGLKISRLTDRIEYLYYKFAKAKLNGQEQWYSTLKQSIDLRNKLVHPKEGVTITIRQVENAVLSVIESANALYLVIYKENLPAYNRGLISKIEL